MTPEQEEQVRRALAAAARGEDQADTGHRPAPLPADVAARLDAALEEELRAPRVTSHEASARQDHRAAAVGEPVTGADELARRRRRRWPTGLIAAAVLCLIALAGGAVAIAGFGPSNESSSSSTVADRSSSAGRAPGGLSSADSSAGSAPDATTAPEGRSPTPSTTTSGPRELAATGASPTFHTDTLTRDIRRLLDLPGALPTGAPPAWRCVAPPLAAGEQLIGVRLDGRRSSMVLGAPTGGQRSARLYSCADPGTLVASTTVPTPDR